MLQPVSHGVFDSLEAAHATVRRMAPYLSDRSWKTSTIRQQPSSECVIVGVWSICVLAATEPAQIGVFLHGTTVPTNAELEGKSARVGLVVIEGCRPADGWATRPPKRSETARSFSKLISHGSEADVADVLTRMRDQVRDALLADGIAPGDMELHFEADLRFARQAFEVPMPITMTDFDRPDALAAAALPRAQRPGQLGTGGAPDRRHHDASR